MNNDVRAERVVAAAMQVDQGQPRSVAEYSELLRAAGHQSPSGELHAIADSLWRKAFRSPEAITSPALLSGQPALDLAAILATDAKKGRRRPREDYIQILYDAGFAGSQAAASFIVSREFTRVFPSRPISLGRPRKVRVRDEVTLSRPTPKTRNGRRDPYRDVVREAEQGSSKNGDAKAPKTAKAPKPAKRPRPEAPKPPTHDDLILRARMAVRAIVTQAKEEGTRPEEDVFFDAVDAAGFDGGFLETKNLIRDAAGDYSPFQDTPAPVLAKTPRRQAPMDWEAKLQARIAKDRQTGSSQPPQWYAHWLQQESGSELTSRQARLIVGQTLLG